jgi:hypothetical protein
MTQPVWQRTPDGRYIWSHWRIWKTGRTWTLAHRPTLATIAYTSTLGEAHVLAEHLSRLRSVPWDSPAVAQIDGLTTRQWASIRGVFRRLGLAEPVARRVA